jgi:hypothetical protein
VRRHNAAKAARRVSSHDVLGAGKKYRTMQVFGSPMGAPARRELLQKKPRDKTCIVRYFLPAPSIPTPEVRACILPETCSFTYKDRNISTMPVVKRSRFAAVFEKTRPTRGSRNLDAKMQVLV